MELEVLIAAMNLRNEQEHKELIERSKITTKSILINQVTKEDRVPFDVKEGNHRLLSFKERGLSKSRNKAIANSVGDIALVCDDDVIYVDGYEKIIKECKDTEIVNQAKAQMEWVRPLYNLQNKKLVSEAMQKIIEKRKGK